MTPRRFSKLLGPLFAGGFVSVQSVVDRVKVSNSSCAQGVLEGLLRLFNFLAQGAFLVAPVAEGTFGTGCFFCLFNQSAQFLGIVWQAVVGCLGRSILFALAFDPQAFFTQRSLPSCSLCFQSGGKRPFQILTPRRFSKLLGPLFAVGFVSVQSVVDRVKVSNSSCAQGVLEGLLRLFNFLAQGAFLTAPVAEVTFGTGCFFCLFNQSA